MKTEKTAYVLYNSERGFRSARSNTRSYKKCFTKAVLYGMKHHASQAASTNDHVIPVQLTLDPEDVCVAILQGTPP